MIGSSSKEEIANNPESDEGESHPGRVPSPPQEAVELDQSESERIAFLNLYNREWEEAFDNLMRDHGVIEYTYKQGLERAKRLSVNSDFQATVQVVRDKWGVAPRLPKEDLTSNQRFPDNILREHVFSEEPSDDEWRRLRADLKKLCRTFDLDWSHDRGLVAAALCFGLTPENLTEHWESIQFTVSVNYSPSTAIVVRRSDLNKKYSTLMAIAYLAHRLKDVGMDLEALPPPIQDWVRLAYKACGTINIHPRHAPKIIEGIHGCPGDAPVKDPELYLRVQPETVKSDLIRVWPAVEMNKVELWGRRKSPSFGVWRSYKRDVELAELAEVCEDYDEVIREYDKRHPEEPLAIDGIISDDTRDLVRQAVKRTRDKGTT